MIARQRRSLAGDPDIDARTATRAHYETYPFIAGGPRRVRHWDRRLRGMLPDAFAPGTLVLDVGCGSGEIGRVVTLRGARPVGVDLTTSATRRTQVANPDSLVCQADALALPFPAATFDYAISIGVLHHTPSMAAGLAELARVTAVQGRIVVLIYARWTPYHLAYAMTAPLRTIPVRRLESLPRWFLRIVGGIVRLQVGQRLPDRELRALLADQFWTPRATFHSYRQLRALARVLDLDVVRRRPLLFHANLLTFVRI